MQNIGADNSGDVFYRYKMPKLVAKVEGRGNGIKTNIVNNVDIAKALERPPTYTIKHFGCELGAQTNFDKKTGTSIVNGAHDAKKLAEVLELFIKKYVQCHKCGNPETIIKIKRECIHLKCKACGHTSDVDMREKLTTFILKNPPDNTMSKAEAKIKKAEKERMKDAEKAAKKELEKSDGKKEKKRKDSKDSKKRSTKDDSEEGSSNGDEVPEEEEEIDGGDEDDGTVWVSDISADAQRQREAEQLSAATAALVQVATDNAAEAAKSVPEVVAEEPEEEADNDDDEREDVDILRDHLDSKNPVQVAATLDGFHVEGGMVGKMKLFYSALLGEWAGKCVERIQSKDKFIAVLGRSPPQQASQLIALEWFITQVQPSRKPEMPFILKMMYEEDLIDDEIIVTWGEQGAIARKHGVDTAAAAEIREICTPVLEWLQESDDEESGSDDEE